MPLDNTGTLDPNNISQEALGQLPDDLQAAIVAAQQDRDRLIEVLGTAVAKKRDEAVRARRESGIETIWSEDEEFFEGIDDANRDDNKLMKPNHPSGTVTTKINKRNTKGGSTVFLNITRQYVNSAAASVSELGNPTDDRNFEFKAAPDPIIEDHVDDQTSQPGSTNATGQPVTATVADHAQVEKDARQKKADAAQDQVDTWMIACQWHAQLRDCVMDSAKIGSGVLKGPFPSIFKARKSVKDAQGNLGMEVSEETIPATRRVSSWNLFPAPDCGDNIQNGSYLLELDFLNARQLRDMKNLPGYIAAQIDKVLLAGPKKNQEVVQNRHDTTVAEENEKYEVWYYYGLLSRDEVDAMGVLSALKQSEDPADQKALKKIDLLEACPCIVTMANDLPIKASLNPLDSGEYPYDILPWEKQEGTPWGKGIARIMRTAQRVTTAALRNLMDNAGLSGGVQIGIKKGSITPKGGNWQMGGITYWELTDDDARSINDCLSFHQIPSIQAELMQIIQFGQKMAEDVTGMPLLLQGQQGAAPDTVGGMQLLNKNSNATRRMKARAVDDELVVPHLRRYYQWIMEYGDESQKGDFIVDARGSQALVERDIARQFATSMLANALQPSFGIDPYKAAANVLRAEMIDPSTWQYDEKTYQQNMQKQAQAASPVIQAAQIRSASAEKIAQSEITARANEEQIRSAGNVSAVQARTARDDQFSRDKMEADNTLRIQELEIDREKLASQERIAMLNYSTQQKISLGDAKTQLAGLSMKLQTEKELNAAQQQMAAAIHVSDKVHDQAAQEAGQGRDIAMQRAGNEQAGFSAAQQSADQASQQQHELSMAAMKQRHAKEMQAMEHAHAIQLQPAVQIPGRAANGQALSQSNTKE